VRTPHTRIRSPSSISDEGIDLSELLDNILHKLVDAITVANVELVCLNLDSILLAQFLRVLLSALRTRCVGDSEIGSHLSTAPGSFNTHTSRPRGARDDDDLAFEAEELQEGV
jgi:hypothetical protein